jgi:hypothetical protein
MIYQVKYVLVAMSMRSVKALTVDDEEAIWLQEVATVGHLGRLGVLVLMSRDEILSVGYHAGTTMFARFLLSVDMGLF